jgi:prophage DNA circulation protein
MAWTDALLPASFRGIPFFIDSHEKKGGRHAVEHEPPERDQPFAEDMGKKSEGYTITGHILGDEYFFIRDALILAMEKKDSGVLVHPYLGLKDVQPKSYTITEDNREGRLCRFTLEFTEAGDPNLAFQLIDLVNKFITTTVSYVLIAKTTMVTLVSFQGLPAYASESAQAIMDDFVASVRFALAGVKSNPESVASLERELSSVESGVDFTDVQGLADSIDSITAKLGEAAVEESDEEDLTTINTKSDVSGNVSVYGHVIDTTQAKLDALALVETKTETRKKERLNSEQILLLIKRLSILRASEAAANASYTSFEAALNQRNDLNDLIDGQLLIEDIDDQLFQALKDQKAANVSMIPDPRKETGTTDSFEVLYEVPSLVFVYEQYGDVSREQDVLDRNLIGNPAFISGDIEVVRFD